MQQLIYNLCKTYQREHVKKQNGQISQKGGLHICEKLLDPRYGNDFLVHLPSGPLPWMAIVLHLVKYVNKKQILLLRVTYTSVHLPCGYFVLDVNLAKPC